jgi:hypothetical protein
LVSKKALAFICLIAVEFEPLRQRALQLAQSPERFLPPAVTRNLKPASAGNRNFDLIAFLELKCLNYGPRQPNRKAIPPLGNLHCDLRTDWIYIIFVYPGLDKVKKIGCYGGEP